MVRNVQPIPAKDIDMDNNEFGGDPGGKHQSGNGKKCSCKGHHRYRHQYGQHWI